MLYEIVGIARVAGQSGTKDAGEIVRHIGKLIVGNRGVIRKIENWGTKPLPKIIKKNRMQYIAGAHFSMKFDASPGVQREVFRQLQTDPRIIRSMVVKTD